VKVRYIGCRREFYEWRLEEVVNLSEEESDSDERDYARFKRPVPRLMSFFEELVYKVKALLTSNRKGDSTC